MEIVCMSEPCELFACQSNVIYPGVQDNETETASLFLFQAWCNASSPAIPSDQGFSPSVLSCIVGKMVGKMMMRAAGFLFAHVW